MPAKTRQAKQEQITTVDEYIQTFPNDVQSILQEIRKTILKTAPRAIEAISYRIPGFKLGGRYLVYIAAFKNHVGMYPAPKGDETFQKEVFPYRSGKATVRFALDKPVPYGLVRKFVRFRIEENRTKKRK